MSDTSDDMESLSGLIPDEDDYIDESEELLKKLNKLKGEDDVKF